MRRNRNYWLAMLLCLVTTVLSLMGENNFNAESIRWFILSDINVAIFLFIAWLFDYKDYK